MNLARVFEHPRLNGRARTIFWTVLALGVVVRLVVAFTTRGSIYDITSFELVRDALNTDPLNLYALVNPSAAPRWPYPPGFLPWVEISDWASNLTGLRFDGFIQLAPIAADAAIAWIVQAFLGQRGADDRTRLLAAGLVSAGPAFVIVSGYHGQIDSVCILPAILALWIWLRSEAPQRALVAGLLIGLGIAIKPLAGLALLALIPSARSLRENVVLVAATVAVPLLMLLPFAVENFGETTDAVLGYHGLAGFGGISLVVQPSLAAVWLGTELVSPSSLSLALNDHGTVIALSILLLVTAILWWRRTGPVVAAVVIWLTFFVFGINPGLTYLILGMPFFLMMGRLREVAAIQLALLIPMLLFYTQLWRDGPIVVVYSTIMIALWAALLAWWVVEMRKLRATSR